MSNPGPDFSRVARLVERARGSAGTPTRTVAACPAAPPLRDSAYVAFGGRAQGYPDPVVWGGRPIARWCRWGFWEPDGSALNVTRIL